MPMDPEESGAYNPAAFVRGLISEGERPTAGLDIFREAGGHIQDSRWFELYREVNNQIANQPDVLGIDPFSVPGPGELGTFEYGAGGKFVTNVELQLIDRGTGLWYTQTVSYWSDVAHTPEEAQAAMFAQWGDPETESEYEQTLMGAVAVSLWQTLPMGSLS